MATTLDSTLFYLLDEASRRHSHDDSDDDEHENASSFFQHYKSHLDHLDVSSKYRLLHQLLCVRPPNPRFPDEVLQHLDSIFNGKKSSRILIQSQFLPPIRVFKRNPRPDVKVTLWRGDITTLVGVTAITNAANGQMLGCFQPSHKCIDNVIHSWAGPRLRDECFDTMNNARGGMDVPPGEAIVTKGYALPCPFVIHTVGPQLNRGETPSEKEISQLQFCYRSVLNETERLPSDEDGRKAVALCCISTGLFAFPADQAAEIAVKEVNAWLEEHQETSITDVIFNVFTESDHEIYKSIFAKLGNVEPQNPGMLLPSIQSDSLSIARQWLNSADAVLVTAGAGISAADGLDYTSTTLFAKHFPGFLKYGLRRLYDVFGFTEWPSEKDRWGYYFTHLNMVRNWPASPMYDSLITWLARFGDNAHVRTSNADGLFLANGLPEERLSTPQGAYAVLQCMDNCRPEATVPSLPLLKEAVKFLDPVTQRLNNTDKIPICQFCGGKMFICVRASSKFNEGPFAKGEAQWRSFRRRVMEDETKSVVILELGAGMNTPGVLRWPDEKLAERSGGRVKLVRVGMGLDASVSGELEAAGAGVAIDGDIKLALSFLLQGQSSMSVS
ncbi:unnamed protein product [Clonostachys byssicola]|uniref:ADP-ribose 1''-phosphate phosphatase n=1 Tax=Clonostachys byssicola TaxID=160290 RepID=A0A9N9UIL0_9HYPO|nr:unnamed protein product [Clonostachys byssicola]